MVILFLHISKWSKTVLLENNEWELNLKKLTVSRTWTIDPWSPPPFSSNNGRCRILAASSDMASIDPNMASTTSGNFFNRSLTVWTIRAVFRSTFELTRITRRSGRLKNRNSSSFRRTSWILVRASDSDYSLTILFTFIYKFPIF